MSYHCFVFPFKKLAVRIQKATKHLGELKTDYGEKAEDLPEVQRKFATFEQDMKVGL